MENYPHPLTGFMLCVPGRTMRPETCCCVAGRAACKKSRTANLHIELPKVFGAHVLEVLFQLLRGHFVRWLGERLRGSLALLQEERGEQTFLGEDRRLESERDRDAVRGTGVDVHGARAARDVQLRVEGPILDLRDVHTSQCASHSDDEILAEIVGKWPLWLELVHLDYDRLRLGLPDPDRQQARSALLLQYHHIGVGGSVQTQSHDFDLYELHEFKVT